MSSHILMATMTGIALSTPAWAQDPVETPIDACLETILFDPAEAPIDREMKVLWLEHIEGLFQENPAAGAEAVRAGLTGRAATPTGPAVTNAKLAAE